MSTKRVFPVDQFSLNILAVMVQATDEEKVVGMSWYSVAREFCVGLAKTYEFRLDKTVGVVATLSPACKWFRNMVDAENLVSAFRGGGEAAAWNVSCCTYGPNKAKAIEILADRKMEVSGRKVTAFFTNIIRPNHPDVVTIDRHAWNICVGERVIIHDIKKVDEGMYVAGEAAYRAVSERIDILPSQVQAITWGVWRRLKNISDY
jgi:hypothetical protein